MNAPLLAHLEAGDVRAAVELVARLSPTERRALAPTLQKLCKGLWFPHEGPERARALVALVTSTPSELERFVKFRIPLEAVDALERVRPDWLEDAAELFVALNPFHFDVARELLRRGLSRRPTHENYILGLIDDTRRGTNPLEADPALLEWEVWRLFEVEGGGERSLAASDKYAKGGNTWTQAFLRLLAAGKLPRARVLDATLDALGRDFAPFRAGWFSRFHEELGVTLPELQARQDRYLRLLHSAVPATVTLALEALGTLDAHAPLPAAPLLPALEPVTLARAKGSALAALRLLQAAVRREPACGAEAARILGQALAHESADVQRAALDGLMALPEAQLEEARAQAAARTEGLAATLRTRAHKWLGDVSTPRAPAPVAAPAPAAPEEPLHPSYAVAALSGFDELLRELTALVEDASDPERLERVLDGLSRLGAARPADFAERVGPLARRARKRNPLLAEDVLLCLGVHLARAWTAPEGKALATLLEAQAAQPNAPDFSLVPTLVARAQALARRLDAGSSVPLLGTPTHRGGWIAPDALVERVLALPPEAVPQTVDEVELSLALLRLAPAGREAALARLQRSGLKGEHVEALAYALGGEAKVGPTAPWWAAAARARAPHASDAAVDARHSGLGPDAAIAATHSWTARTHVTSHGYVFHCLYVDVQPELPPVASAIVPWHPVRNQRIPGAKLPPPALIAVRRYESAGGGKGFLRWLATAWPAGTEAYFAAAAPGLFMNNDWGEARWGDVAFHEALGAPTLRFGPMATLVLAIGLGAKDPGQSTTSCDAAIAALGSGRLSGVTLGATMLQLRDLGGIKLKRWAATLKAVAAASPAHAEQVSAALQGCLRGAPASAPRDEGALVALLGELLAELQQPLRDPLAWAYLQGSKHRRAFAPHAPAAPSTAGQVDL